VALPGGGAALRDAGYGVWEGVLDASTGSDYRYVLDEGRPGLPDPASRWQPDGLLGSSRVFEPPPLVTPVAGGMPALPDLVIYELHVGTFSLAGTFSSAMSYLDELARLGVNAIELMPIAEFPGARGWGYDGVFISAAHSSYGGPHGLCELVEAAHGLGIAVILDVVYNHVGAEGTSVLDAYGPYMTSKYETPWGKAMNYDDARCDPVREWACQSAEGWIADFGIDGLRLDAIHAIHDSSAEHIVEAIARRVHAVRDDALVIAESGMNDPRVIRRGEVGGWGCDAAWADDFHHSVRTLVTDEREGYYEEFGRVELLAKAMHRPHVHDGSYSRFRRRRFGAPAYDVPVERFVVFSQDHDQVGNRAYGDRMPEAARPLAAFLTLLSPFTPMLFMGEEYGEPAPFQFFSDHIDPYIAEQTRKGRRAEFAAFAAFGAEIPDPESIDTFNASKLTRRRDATLAALYAQLLAARRELPHGDVDEIVYDEDARWLTVARGPFTLLASFASEPVGLSVAGEVEIVVATHPEQIRVEGGVVSLPALSGALLRGVPV
jgi:maltooligosyltrehalose trehalohydrolase